jgi:glutaredoxin
LRLTIYSKPGCHLCDEMKAVVHRVLESRGDVPLDEIDVSADPALLDRYGLEVPVLLIDGTKVAKYRIAEEELARMVDSRGKK